MWLPLLACLFLVGHFTNQAGALDLGTVGGMYLGIFLAGGFFLSFGCLASALSRSQMVAAMISLAFGVSQFALAWWAKNHAGRRRLAVAAAGPASTCSTR